MNIRDFKFPGIFPQFYRFVFLCIFLLALLGYSIEREGRLPFQLRREITAPSPFSQSLPRITSQELLENINAQRRQQNLAELQSNATLEKATRLLSLEIEDSQEVALPENVRPFLSSVSSSLPREIETFAVFLSGVTNTSQLEPVASSSAIQSARFTQIGITTRRATFQDVEGMLAVIMISPSFQNNLENSGEEVRPATVSSQPPTYTGQDLWAAVQNYRRAHSLFEFQQANELCTVASIRVNELIELGRLDNHDGFGPRSEQFFERNPSWTAINENLASGYATAVQVVEWGWDQSLGHKALIQSTEFPYACTAANQGYAVLITGK